MVQSTPSTDGTTLRQPRLPHLLVARNPEGETASIPVLIKTQGSDTKLVGQMQPFGEAKSLDRQPFGGAAIPPYSLQIGDGENGGVMMNEFPSAYERAFDELGAGVANVAAMNGTEYLEALAAMGVDEQGAFPTVQPVSQTASGADDRLGPAPRRHSRARARSLFLMIARRGPATVAGSRDTATSWIPSWVSALPFTNGGIRSRPASTPSTATPPTAVPCCTYFFPRPAAFATGATVSGQTLHREICRRGSPPRQQVSPLRAQNPMASTR